MNKIFISFLLFSVSSFGLIGQPVSGNTPAALIKSGDEQIEKAYVNDPLVHDQASVALGAFLIDGAEYVLAHADEWQLPLFLAHGSADGICPIAGSESFMKATKPDAPVIFKVWEGAYHETHNEPNKELAINAFLDWIDEQRGQI